MKNITNILGIALICLGIVGLAYNGFSYTKREKIAEIGDLQLTADTKEVVYFPPMLGGLSLAAGVALVIVARMTRKG